MTLLDAGPDADLTVGTPVDPRHRELRSVRLGNVRAAFSPVVYERSMPRALAWFAFDIVVYVGFLMGTLFAPGIPLKLLFGLLTGLAVSALFVWAHDAAHGALFGQARYGEVLGTIAMLPSLNMYRLWMYGHNKVHHGFTSFSPVDWIWRPKTPAEYVAASRWSKLVYRVERSLPGCGVHYLLRVWWPGMVMFRPGRDTARKHHFGISRAITATFAVGLATGAWFAGGVWAAVAAVLVPFAVFTTVIALFVYLHHTHPRLPFFDDRQRWNAATGQVACSTIVRLSAPANLLTHSIMVHTPHHVDTRIPFYRLQQAYADLAPTYGDLIVEYDFHWKTVSGIFSTCKVFDFDKQVWYRFADLKVLTIEPVAAKPASAPASVDA